MRARELFALFVSVALAIFPGCDTGRFTASQSIGLITRGAAAIQEHWDPVLVGDAMPGSILQLEGLYATLPEDDRVGLELLRAYVSYAYGWLEPEAEEAEARGDLDAQEETMRRARLMYLRARNIGMHHIRLRDAGFDAAVSGDHDAFVRYLESRYRTAEDVPFLLWTGYAWGSAISVATDDPELVLDLPKVRAMVERAVELDPSYFEHGGLMFLGALASSVPESLGGDPAQGRILFERALAGTNRSFFQIQLQFARTYAVTTGDRALFIALLREIIDGGDPRADVRLANRLARRRAIRLLQRVDELF
ncbi:TRAP transporter TatT component family protein [Sandaracinus amylolyticus]|uniref:TRAP transporter TatT component family protein n=1 Tax=Sandaracinus amylolyticus TaxID=927083 RepID=UPI0012EDBC61|nr:TRAP transporter TatT component family protein [Sandaracinus amylolyticus]